MQELSRRDIRAALGYLDWTQRDLAMELDEAPQQVNRFLNTGSDRPNKRREAKMQRIREVLERAGITFLPGGGVKPIPPAPQDVCAPVSEQADAQR